jgi:hypothetical protein
MTNNITKRIQVIFRCVFKGFLAYLVSGPKSAPGFLLVFVLIMTDKVILDHEMSYLVYFENFHFLWFLHLWQIFAKIEKNENFQNWPNMTFYGLKWLYLEWFPQKLAKSGEVRGSPVNILGPIAPGRTSHWFVYINN